jgi:hypothetical protein
MNSTEITGGKSMDSLAGGEFSVFAMNRGKQRFIDILTTWENAKNK